jgi:Tol biopolymer transport system component
MNPSDRLERDLVTWFADSAAPRVPGYRDDIVRAAARTRQRPRWTFPERWLPMRATALSVQARSVPWRTIGLLAALLLLLALAAAVYVSGQRHVPAPYGPATNGSIALVARPAPPADPPTRWVEPYGDILAVDPATGHSRVLVGGPTLDGQPVFSRDGTRLAFVRQVEDGVVLFAADASGGQPVRLTPQPLDSIREVAWSPDGQSVAFSSARGLESDLWIASTDGSAAHRLDLGMSAISPAWRPPDGAEILYVGSSSPGIGPIGGYRGLWTGDDGPDPSSATGMALYRVRPDGTGLTPITPADGHVYEYSHTCWTPDGRRIVTQVGDPFDYLRVVVLDPADGHELARISPETSSDSVMAAVISPDGRRLAYVDITQAETWRVHVRPLDGSGPDLTLPHEFVGGAASLAWSPDGRLLIVNHHYFPGTWLLDPDGGPDHQALFTDPGFSEWQRLAP